MELPYPDPDELAKTGILERWAISRGTFRIEIMKEEHAEQSAELLSHLWPSSNVITRTLGITEKEYRPWAERNIARAIQEELSMVCIDERTNKVVGFEILSDLNGPKLDTSGLDPRFAIHFAFLDLVEGAYRKQYSDTPHGVIAYIVCAGISAAYGGLGLVSRMGLWTVWFLWKLGYQRLSATATHAASQFLALRKVGFHLVNEYHYTDFVYDGKRYLESITEPKAATLFEGDIDTFCSSIFEAKMKYLNEKSNRRAKL